MREITMEDEVTIRVQCALENVARVIDKHGDLSVGDNDPDAMYYSLEIAVDMLQEAEAILEAGPPAVDQEGET